MMQYAHTHALLRNKIIMNLEQLIILFRCSFL